MEKPIIIAGRTFRTEVIEHLKKLELEQPDLGSNEFARVVCELVGWYSPTGRAALASAKGAVRKLRRRGVLRAEKQRMRAARKRRMKGSGQALPGLVGVPRVVGQVRGLYLYLLNGHKDREHGTWNDLIMQQHPCGDAPLAGPQLRYLIGSEHGWLGAVGITAGSFVLGARDQWIGWSTPTRVAQLRKVVNLARLLIREEVRCWNLASKALSMLAPRVITDWKQRYGTQPLLMETFVDRARFTGMCFAAANWLRIGRSTGRGRLGPRQPTISAKDIWVYELDKQARRKLQEATPPALTPVPMLDSLAQADFSMELAQLELGDERRVRRLQEILQLRWARPQASLHGSFDTWSQAKAAYGLLENKQVDLSLVRLLEAHAEMTQARMAAEPIVLLPQDTTTLNYSGLKCTKGLGPLGDAKGRGLWLHSMLAYRPDAVPLGVLAAKCWARSDDTDSGQRNAKAIDEKESARWVETLHQAGVAARRMPQTKLVVITDREGDIYELHETLKNNPPNLHTLVRAQHDRNLSEHRKLWEFLKEQPVGDTRQVALPRGHGQSARTAQLEVRWTKVTIESPKVGCKKGWPSLQLTAVWVHEPNPPSGVEPIDWMLLTDLPVNTAAQAWEIVQWYRIRWGIEEWHRVLKTGCNAEGRELKSAETLQRVLALDMIVAWRVLACLKLGRAMPQLPASVIYTQDELMVLTEHLKKNALSHALPL